MPRIKKSVASKRNLKDIYESPEDFFGTVEETVQVEGILVTQLQPLKHLIIGGCVGNLAEETPLSQLLDNVLVDDSPFNKSPLKSDRLAQAEQMVKFESDMQHFWRQKYKERTYQLKLEFNQFVDGLEVDKK